MTQPPLPTGQPPVEVRRSARRRKTLSAYREGETIVVLAPASLTRAEEARLVPDLVRRVLARETRRRPPRGDAELRRRAAELAERFLAQPDGHVPAPADVRWVGNMTTRWASCTVQTGEIRVSDRLRTMPAWVVDYVLVHELAHLLERDHSARFWALVAAYPQTERARGYLEGYEAGQRDSASAQGG